MHHRGATRRHLLGDGRVHSLEVLTHVRATVRVRVRARARVRVGVRVRVRVS